MFIELLYIDALFVQAISLRPRLQPVVWLEVLQL